MNLRPSGYEPDELPDCSTPRYLSCFAIIAHIPRKCNHKFCKYYRSTFSFPDFAFPWISGTGGTSFFGKCCFLLLCVPWGSLGSGRRMPAFAIFHSPFRLLLPLCCSMTVSHIDYVRDFQKASGMWAFFVVQYKKSTTNQLYEMQVSS